MRCIWVCLFTLLTACQVNKKPDLAQLYQQHGTDHSNTPLILIHGTMGSKLRMKESGDEVWPGKINQLIFSNYSKLANQISPETIEIRPSEIEAYAIFDSYSGISIYDEIIQTLSEFGDFHLSTLGEPIAAGRSLYVFNYDWRQDNVHNAQLLSQFIDKVLKKHPQNQQIDVVAHSMGGLILRYYQRFGDLDVLEQLQDLKQTNNITTSKAHVIRHAIFLGTPQLGSVKSITRLQKGFDFNLRNIPVEVQITMPSVFQLLPHPAFSWAADLNGNAIDVNIYNSQIWQDNQWSIYNPSIQKRIIKHAVDEQSGQQQVETLIKFFNRQLQRAESFWLALSPEFEVPHEGFIIMGGDCKKTLSQLMVGSSEGKLQLYDELNINDDMPTRSLQKDILYEPGDGQVSKSSLMGQIHNENTHETTKTIKIKYPVFVCEDHIRLTQNITFQDNLLHLLLNL